MKYGATEDHLYSVSDEELIKSLITPDGVGTKTKLRCLLELLTNRSVNAIRERVENECK